MQLSFFVPGIPSPGGSKTGFPVTHKNGERGVVIVDAGGAKTKKWRKNVAAAAYEAVNSLESFSPISVPVSIDVTFYMPRPKYHLKSNGEIKKNAPSRHCVSPDATKLFRSTEDALKGIIWKDDCLVDEQHVMKKYADLSVATGALITVWWD